MSQDSPPTALHRGINDSEISQADRLRGAIWGQFVGDAFCLGSHWIYDLAELETAYPGGVRGFEAPRKGHYHFGKHPGDQTHYGDGALVMLESVAALGRFDEQDFLQRFVELFGSPTYNGYLDKATRGTLENLRVWRDGHPGQPAADAQNGADDDQLATASRLAPVVVTHLSDQNLPEVAERATRVSQNNALAVTFMQANALILRDLLNGSDLPSAFQLAEEAIVQLAPTHGSDVRQSIAAALNASPKPVLQAIVDEFGQSCPLVSSFPSAVHCAVKHHDSFADAMTANARAGGDSAGRAGLIGGWLGALNGIQGIPEEWRNRLSSKARIAELVERLVKQTSA